MIVFYHKIAKRYIWSVRLKKPMKWRLAVRISELDHVHRLPASQASGRVRIDMVGGSDDPAIRF